MSLLTGNDYATQAQVLLNDTAGTRYTTAILLEALGMGLGDMMRLRPDLFMDWDAPYPVAGPTDLSKVDRRYRAALLDYIVGYAERIDQETSDTARATMYYASFSAKLIGSAT